LYCAACTVLAVKRLVASGQVLNWSSSVCPVFAVTRLVTSSSAKLYEASTTRPVLKAVSLYLVFPRLNSRLSVKSLHN
jgi:hypothetical protein